MGAKRGTSGLVGVLAIDKPYGMTSHDVVNRVRHITGERRVGHAGTLDPAATGLMLVGVGAATRLSEYLTGHDKEYDARIVFGVATDTDDAQGRVLVRADAADIPDLCNADDAHRILLEFTGTFDQLPPAYSAIKKNGVVAYKAAREGTGLELEPRPVTVHAARFDGCGVQDVRIDDGQGGVLECALPYWDVHFHVSKGTYIRALARDIGTYLGCMAHLCGLRRTSIAEMPVERACTLEELEMRMQQGDELPWCDPVRLLGFPAVELGSEQQKYVENGRELTDKLEPGEGLVSCVSEGKLLAVYGWNDGACLPETVIPGGVRGVA